MTKFKLLQSKRNAILALAERHGAKNVRVFGSLARGEERPESDIDLLVDMEPGRSLFDLLGYWDSLEKLLRCRVDVGTAKSLKTGIRQHVLREARPL